MAPFMQEKSANPEQSQTYTCACVAEIGEHRAVPDMYPRLCSASDEKEIGEHSVLSDRYLRMCGPCGRHNDGRQKSHAAARGGGGV